MKYVTPAVVCQVDRVAPLVGAWIEIDGAASTAFDISVAPLVGAWIEILRLSRSDNGSRSLPSWERGLKYVTPAVVCQVDRRSPRGSVD